MLSKLCPFVGMLLICGSTLLAQPRYTCYFAQVADGNGLTTAIVLLNPLPSPASAQLYFTASDGASMQVRINGVTNSSFDVTIAPRSVKRLQTDGTSPIQRTGWLAVRSDRQIDGVALFQFSNSRGDLLTEAGVSRSTPTKNFELFASSVASINTGVAIANPSDRAASVTMKLVDLAGVEAGRTIREIPVGQHLSRFVTELFPSVANFEGALVIESTQPIIATAIRLQSQPSLMVSALPVVRVKNDIGETKSNGVWAITLENAKLTRSFVELIAFLSGSGNCSFNLSEGETVVMVRFTIKKIDADAPSVLSSDYQLLTESDQIVETGCDGRFFYGSTVQKTIALAFKVTPGSRGFAFRFQRVGSGAPIIFDLSNLE